MKDRRTIFIETALELFPGKYDYSLVEYKDNRTPVKLICPLHGVFSIRPGNHIGKQRQGCRQCGYLNRDNKRKDPDVFIQQVLNKWGDRYDLTKTKYITKNVKIIYDCPIHGEIEQLPTLFLKHGCQFCAGRGVTKHTIESFLKKAREVHGDFYGYDKVRFDKIHDTIIITCPIHGDFYQIASNHINSKHGCQKCNGGVKITQDEFIYKANIQHNNKFDYSLTKYTKAHDYIKAICPKHGEFEQLAYMHLQTEYCCPGCVGELTSSKAEQDILDFITQYYKNEIIRNERKILNGKEIDIFLPDANLGIEFHGCYWHTETRIGKHLHKLKSDLASEKDIKLIQIFEYEWNNKRDIVFSRLLSNLGCNKKVYARNTKIVELNLETKNNFLEQTHIQGSDSNSDIYLGLEYNGELIGCMTFGRPRFNKEYDYELIRYSSALNINILGGAGKLLKCFQNNYKGSIISYADRRWSNGNLYEKLGFKYLGNTEPGYVYYNLKTKKILSRMNCQRHKLKKMSFYDENLTEYQIMKLNDFDRLWDAGNSRWSL